MHSRKQFLTAAIGGVIGMAVTTGRSASNIKVEWFCTHMAASDVPEVVFADFHRRSTGPFCYGISVTKNGIVRWFEITAPHSITADEAQTEVVDQIISKESANYPGK